MFAYCSNGYKVKSWPVTYVGWKTIPGDRYGRTPSTLVKECSPLASLSVISTSGIVSLSERHFEHHERNLTLELHWTSLSEATWLCIVELDLKPITVYQWGWYGMEMMEYDVEYMERGRCGVKLSAGLYAPQVRQHRRWSTKLKQGSKLNARPVESWGEAVRHIDRHTTERLQIGPGLYVDAVA